MTVEPDIVAGTVSVSAGGTTVTGVGTAWKSVGIRAGDTLIVGGAFAIVTADATSETSLTIEPWPGSALSGSAYRIRLQPDGSRYSAAARELVELLSAKGFFKWDADGDTAGRAAYDSKPQGFSYLDTSGDPLVLYVKKSDTSGDWSAGVSFAEGPKGNTGPAPTLTFADVVTGDAGTDASLDVTGTGPYGLGFTIPRGNKGDAGWAIEPELVADGQRKVIKIADYIGGEGDKPTGTNKYIGATGLVDAIADAIDIRGSTGPQGDRGVTWRSAWDIGTDYVANDVVTADDANGNPAAWIALTATTGDDPKSSATEWALFPASFPAAVDYGLITASADVFRDYGAIA